MSDCCSTSTSTEPTPRSAALRLFCPRCGHKGKTVSLLTLKHQIRPVHLAAVEGGLFAFCATPDCPVVYFNETGMALPLQDVRLLPTAKTSANPPLCYCFGFDTAMVRAEIIATGRCTIPQRIAAEMKADRCACEIRNPQGSCCFANVTAAVKRELATIESDVQSATTADQKIGGYKFQLPR